MGVLVALSLSQLLINILSCIKDGRIPMVCSKCGAEEGTVMCDRSLLGEEGACEFKPKLVTHATTN